MDSKVVLNYILMKVDEQNFDRAFHYSKNVLPKKLGSLGNSKSVRLLQRSLKKCVNNEDVELNKCLAKKFLVRLF